MSVLEQLRSGSDSSFMQVVMFVVILSFIFWYATPQGDQANVVAEVNGQRIMSTEYGREFRNYQRYEENRLQRTLSNEEQEQLGEQVKDFLVDRELIRQGADELGITVSDDEVADRIINDRANLDNDGNFDMKLFERQLKYAQLTREAFEAKLREQIRQEKVMRLVQMGATVSEPVVRRAWHDANTKVDLEYVLIREFSFLGDVQITDEERAAWLTENDVMANERYEADFKLRYDHPAQLRVSMIRLAEFEDGPRIGDLKVKLQTAADAIAEGADFAEMAKRLSEDPTAAAGGDRGLRPVEQYDPKELEVLEGVEPGTLTRVFVLNGTEVRLYRVEEKIDPRVDAFEDVRDDIAKQMMTQERLPALAVAFAEEKVLPAWTEAGAAPSEVVATKSLFVQNTGPVPLQGAGGLARPPEDMMRAAEVADVGSVLPEVYEKDGTYWVGQLKSREEPDETSYDDQKDMLRGQALQSRRQAFFGAWVEDRKATSASLR
jgi:peptidyl-prolyl cis-trans isomerase D